MADSYAARLSEREDKGVIGEPELFDEGADVKVKVGELAQLIHDSKYIVVHTGAGISTSAGIADFRGPTGIWTLEKSGKPITQGTGFEHAHPTLTHMALLALVNAGKVRYIVSQNVDGLHLRSGVPGARLAELHGNMFLETCEECEESYFRDFDVGTVSFNRTGRLCTAGSCLGHLKDCILDWEDALPEDDLDEAEKQSRKADLALCLGTSLQITPSCDIPLKTVRKRKNKGKLAICNLQKTPKDKFAKLIVRARVDEVMKEVMAILGIRIPSYSRTDRIRVGHSLSKPQDNTGQGLSWTLSFCDASGYGLQMPMVKKVIVSRNKPSGEPHVLFATITPPFELSVVANSRGKDSVVIEVEFAECCTRKAARFEYTAAFDGPSTSRVYAVETVHLVYDDVHHSETEDAAADTAVSTPTGTWSETTAAQKITHKKGTSASCLATLKNRIRYPPVHMFVLVTVCPRLAGLLEEPVNQWVQCDNPNCGVWRRFVRIR